MKGLKDFITRGSLIDTAVAFIMGAAFGTVVTAFTRVILDLLGKIGGTPDFSSWAPGGVHIGAFLTALISFVMLAIIIYFAIVVPIGKLRSLHSHEEASEPSESEVELLGQIRDLLAAGDVTAAQGKAAGQNGNTQS